MYEEKHMKSLIPGTAVRVVLAVFLAAFSYALSPCGQAQSGPKESRPPAPRAFNTPQEAADALINAEASYDVPTLFEIFGAEGRDFKSSPDPVRNTSIAA